jgi:hypothetical protein
MEASLADDLPMPLGVLLHTMRQRWREGRVDEAVALAKATAPYLHPKAGPRPVSVDLAMMEDEELHAICRRGVPGTRSADVDQG